MIEGGCFCKAVRYAIDEGEYLTANCHCSMCRHIHAAPFVTWIVVPVKHFRYLAEAPQKLESSADGTRHFCRACGTHMACVNAGHPDVIDVSVGSLDTPQAFKPTMDVFADTRLPWISA